MGKSIEELTFMEKMYGVLIRDEKLNLRYLFDTKDYDSNKNKDKFAEFAKENFPELYKEAEAIVNNPNRKLHYVFADDIDHLIKQKDLKDLEYGDLYSVLSDFVLEYGLQDKLSEFLHKAKKDESMSDTYAFCMEELLADFGKKENE